MWDRPLFRLHSVLGQARGAWLLAGQFRSVEYRHGRVESESKGVSPERAVPMSQVQDAAAFLLLLEDAAALLESEMPELCRGEVGEVVLRMGAVARDQV